ncbi:MAG: hypothetical protein QW279_11015 [Candidatus Jordarchaeaceae archaeon]
MSRFSQTGFILVGVVGGLLAIFWGVVMFLIGAFIRGNIILFMEVYFLSPTLMQQFLSYLSVLVSPVFLVTLGPLGGYFLGNLLWDITTFGIIVSVHGFIILLSAFGAWMGNKWYAFILIIFGLMGVFAFLNLGGLMGLVSGVVLWYQLK